MTRESRHVWTEQELETRYSNLFGRAAGYLPKSRAVLDVWLDDFSRDVHERRARNAIVRHWSVADLARLIEHDGIVRMYLSRMIDEANRRFPHNKHKMNDIPDLLDHLDCIVTSTPRYGDGNSFPLSSLFAYPMMTTDGYAVFRDQGFNKALLGILREWCAHLDGKGSQEVLNKTDGWLSPDAWQDPNLNLKDFRIDLQDSYGGFPSFNAFFHRELKDGVRPIDEPDDPRIIVSANDGKVVRIRRGIQRTDEFWAKGQRYSLYDMLDGSDLTDLFIGGDVFQSFLSGGDYHRWHAPATGVVRSARVVEALMFTELEGVDEPHAGTQSQVYGASVNTRGLVFIECPPPIGMVCVMPLGMTEISSITLTVQPGDQVAKGDELGYFSYGGSSMCLLFQKGAVDTFCPKDNTTGDMEKGDPIKVNARIAQAAAHTGKA